MTDPRLSSFELESRTDGNSQRRRATRKEAGESRELIVTVQESGGLDSDVTTQKPFLKHFKNL